MTARRGALVAALAAASVLAAASPSTAATGGRWLYVFEIPHASFEQLLALPNVARLAHAGGAALMSIHPDAAFRPALVWRSPPPDAGGGWLPVPASGPGRADALAAADAEIGRSVRAVSDGTTAVTVVVLSLSSSDAMLRAGDELHPVVVASGTDVLGVAGPPNALTSDSTRREGVVSNLDVAPTIAARFGARFPGASEGFPVRTVAEDAPFELHERYLAMRRMTVPVQTAAALYVTIAGLFAVLVLGLGRRVPRPLGVLACAAAVSVGPLAAALLEAGHLPTLSYATVLSFVVVVTALVAGVVMLGATRELLHPVLPLGVLLLGALVAEDALGWTAAQTPFLGGSELDGGRFFGLPNVFIGLLLGASLYAAARLPAGAGFAVLVGGALLAGLPSAGANLGGAVTLFAAAGLWLPLRSRGRLRLPELAFAAAVVVIGTAAILLAHRVSSLPTHLTAFEETEGAGGAWSAFVGRLGVGWRLIRRNPFALVPVVGLLATLAIVVRPPESIAPSLSRHPAWRDALLVLLVASVVAYVVNDSGPAACGVGFGMALGGMLYVSVAERTWKMVPA